MVDDLENVEACSWRCHQYPPNEVFGQHRDLLMLGEMVVVAPNAIVSCFYIVGVERRLSRQKCENNDADSPDIDFERVAPLRLKQLRRQIVGRTTESFLGLPFMIELGSQTKITNLDLHLTIEEEIR